MGIPFQYVGDLTTPKGRPEGRPFLFSRERNGSGLIRVGVPRKSVSAARMGASCSFGALHKDFRDIIGAVEMDVVAGGDFDDAPEGEPAGTLHRKGDGVKLHGRAGNIGYGNAVALGDTDVDAIEIGLDGLRGHVVSEPFPHGLGGEMSRSRGGNADPAVMARPEDTLLGFVVRDQIHCAFAGFGDHCVEIDDMAEALRDALGDRRQDNPRVAVPHKHNVSQAIVLDQVDHIHDVGFQRDPVGKEMGALGKPGEAHGENRMPGIAEPVRHRLPAPCPAP